MTSERARGSSREDSGERDALDEPFVLQAELPVLPGSTVADKYRIDRKIGFGGMGVVCEATHVELGAKVAIKFVRLEHAGDDRAVARFLTEARSAAQLKSQHTCRVVDCGRLDSGSPYMVMEYLEGADLRAVVSAQGPLPVDAAVSFALQVCEALAEAHARRIVHRDIKPENLFLTQGPDGAALIKVLDFGISKQLGRSRASRALTEPTESIGSPFHMSPEQMIDPTGVDARTDVWSLGVVLYELLTGRLPFVGDSTPQVCANVMTREPASPREFRPEISEGLARVVLGCLKKDREARFADVAALSRALKDFGGTTSGLAAERVERILVRARENRAESRRALREEEPSSAKDLDEDSAVSVPGLPRKRSGVRLLVVLMFTLGALGAFGYSRVRVPRTEPPLPVPLPVKTDTVALPDEPLSSPPVASQEEPAREAKSTEKRPLVAEPKKRKPLPRKPVPSADPDPNPSVEPPASEPAPESSSLYPVITPLPEMPLPQQ